MTNLVGQSDHESNDRTPVDRIGHLIDVSRDLDRFDREVLARAVSACESVAASTDDHESADFAELEGTPGYRKNQIWLDAENREAVVKAYLAGATVYEAAEQFGIHRTTVARIVRRAGHKVARTGLLPHELREAIRLYEAGASLVKVAKRFETSPEHVRTRLIEAGVAMRPRGGSRTQTIRHTPSACE